MEQLKRFLDENIRALDASKPPKPSSLGDQQSTLPERTTQSFQGNTKSRKPSSCSLRNDNHSINQCEQLSSKKLTNEEILQGIKECVSTAFVPVLLLKLVSQNQVPPVPKKSPHVAP